MKSCSAYPLLNSAHELSYVGRSRILKNYRIRLNLFCFRLSVLDQVVGEADNGARVEPATQSYPDWAIIRAQALARSLDHQMPAVFLVFGIPLISDVLDGFGSPETARRQLSIADYHHVCWFDRQELTKRRLSDFGQGDEVSTNKIMVQLGLLAGDLYKCHEIRRDKQLVLFAVVEQRPDAKRIASQQ